MTSSVWVGYTLVVLAWPISTSSGRDVQIHPGGCKLGTMNKTRLALSTLVLACACAPAPQPPREPETPVRAPDVVFVPTPFRVVDAKQAYERALSLDPEHLKALKNLAQLEARTGLLGVARTHLIDALDRDPTDQELRLELAQLMLTERDFAGCSHAAQLVLAQTPNHRDAMALLNSCARQ